MKSENGEKTLRLDATIDKGGVRVGVAGYAEAFCPYTRKRVDTEVVAVAARRLSDAVNHFQRSGDTASVLEKLESAGEATADLLLSPAVKNRLSSFTGDRILFDIDEALVHVPWELIRTGGEFLCRRFETGRVVKTGRSIRNPGGPVTRPPLSMWIVTAERRASAPMAAESRALCRMMDRWVTEPPPITVSYDTGVDLRRLRRQMGNFDILHFTGHAVFAEGAVSAGGWRLTDGLLTAADVRRAGEAGAIPRLVFSNACQTARTESWKSSKEGDASFFGLADAFLSYGARHYLGTLWEIPDADALHFAETFYRRLASGDGIGRAVLEARRAVSTVAGIAYVLYGEPAVRYFGETVREDDAPRVSLASSNKGRGFPQTGRGRLRKPAAAAVLLFLGIIAFTGARVVLPTITGEVETQRLRLLHTLAEEKRRRIEGLMKDLAEINPPADRPAAPRTALPDSWSSKPLTMSVDIGVIPDPAVSETTKLVAATVLRTLAEETRVVLLERLSLDILLEELKRANSPVTDAAQRIVPALMSARLVLFVETTPGRHVLLHLSETRTGRVVFSKAVLLKSGPSVSAQRKRLSAGLIDLLVRRYPLRGRILTADRRGLKIDIGTDAGVRPGQVFQTVKGGLRLPVAAVMPARSLLRPPPEDPLPETGARIVCADK